MAQTVLAQTRDDSSPLLVMDPFPVSSWEQPHVPADAGAPAHGIGLNALWDMSDDEDDGTPWWNTMDPDERGDELACLRDDSECEKLADSDFLNCSKDVLKLKICTF